MNQGGDKETPKLLTLGRGRLINGKWHCECDHAAHCRTTKKPGPNKGRKFWSCSNVNNEQCTFFLWVDQEEAAKEWLKTLELPPRPKTPTKTGVKIGDLDSGSLLSSRDQHRSPQFLETPFTKAKRKAAPKDVNEIDDDYNNRNLDANVSDPFTYSHQTPESAGKAARTFAISTPGQKFIERHTVSLPTPTSRDHMHSGNTMASRVTLQPLDASPTPYRFNDRASLDSREESDLSTTVLDLIRADYPKLKASTEMQIRHEINLALDVAEAKLRRHEATISELHKKVDELEEMVLHLT